ncbi:protein RRP5 [Caerostris darwini]|uniref:Protein RRP5 n=1 Tax=Caerostris darwini TaxID=1538125 RepID=A0AAV4VN33_9ARAC|nr:protein RRP5 [Caerostris darwini]
MSLRNCNQDVTEASKISGTILYVHPVTRMIYLLLGPKPTPSTFTNFFRVKKFDLLKNVKYQYSFHHRLLFKVHHGPIGFVYENDLTKTEVSTDSLAKNSVVPMARVLFLHYMDNLIHLSFKKSVCESEIIRPEDVQIGDIYEATVKKHSVNGMFVSICVGFGGFVRKLFLSDILVSMPEKLYPVDSKVKCRVISLHPQSGFNMTCKDSLLQLPPEGILKSYDQAHIGQFYKGVIVQKTDTFIVVLFFNDIKGVVPLNYIPQSAVFYEGQTVSCHVIWCEPKRKKLKLSLLGDKQSSDTNTSMKQSKIEKKNKVKKTIDPEKDQFDPKKTHKAVIKSITGNQLNIVLDGGLIGRIHITELGCSQENFRPLTEFSAGQNLKVHIIGINSKRSVNYLAITNRVMKHFCECALEYPPPVPLERKFHPGMTVMGYIKEISDIAVSLWLSPNQTGTLDYLHFSDNPKILRKLKKKLKVGSSLTANILDVQEKGDACRISLTKIENKPLEAGFNIVGLVQVASPEKGLIIKLPNGYHGTVSLVDLQDVYVPAKAELQKQHKLRFILCHLLEVNSVTKFCQLSLRKSRLYNLQGNCLKGIEPELTIEDIQQGKKLKGYIKVANSNYFIVNFGRMLDGKVPLHQCSTYGCSLCKHCQNAVKKYSIGDVLEVVIESVKASKGLYPLSLPELVGLGANEHSRLNLTEDINWSEM